MAEFFLGSDCKAYYGTAGSTAASEITNIRDVTLQLDTVTADVTSRAAQGWEETVAALKKGQVSFQIVAKTTDAAMSAIRTAFNNRAPIALKFTDDSGSGVSLDADFVITQCQRTEPLTEAVMWDVTAILTKSTRVASFA